MYVVAIDQVSDSPIYELEDDEEDTEEKGVNIQMNECMYTYAHVRTHTHAIMVCISFRLSGDGIRRHEGLLPTTKEEFFSATVGFQEDDC